MQFLQRSRLRRSILPLPLLCAAPLRDTAACRLFVFVQHQHQQQQHQQRRRNHVDDAETMVAGAKLMLLVEMNRGQMMRIQPWS